MLLQKKQHDCKSRANTGHAKEGYKSGQLEDRRKRENKVRYMAELSRNKYFNTGTLLRSGSSLQACILTLAEFTGELGTLGNAV